MTWHVFLIIHVFFEMSDEQRKKKTPTFHYTGWLIGILIMVYYNPYITG